MIVTVLHAQNSSTGYAKKCLIANFKKYVPYLHE